MISSKTKYVLFLFKKDEENIALKNMKMKILALSSFDNYSECVDYLLASPDK